MGKTVNFKGTVLFFAVTIILAAISAFCISGTVMSKSDIEYVELENYYRAQESELLSQTKELLEEMGYKNSGVTLTRVVDEDGNREYTFMIHHGKIDKMSEEERTALAKQLACNTTFGGEVVGNSSLLDNCSFFHEFLMYE